VARNTKAERRYETKQRRNLGLACVAAGSQAKRGPQDSGARAQALQHVKFNFTTT
jgi:hypothetical protein